MKRLSCLLLVLTLGCMSSSEARAYASAASLPGPSAIIQGRNSVSGTVFGENRRPLVDVYVELLSEFGVTINQTKTTGAGRYNFFGLGDGRYKIRVSPYGTDYVEQLQEVSLLPLSAIPGSGAENLQLDFYLKLRANANAGPFAAPGVVFAQEVPDAAKKLYQKGISDLSDKKEKEGFESLRKSLEVFPNYFLALDRLGTEYAVRGNQDKRYFEAARILLTKAIEVNPKSFSSAFGLGFSQYHLGLFDQAAESLQRATNLYVKSINAHLWLGIAQKRLGKLVQAEASLKRADEMSKSKEADVHWHLAGLYNDQKRYREAADEFEKFLKTKPDARDAEKIRQMIAQLRSKALTP